ncbi:MAG TPA: hypothetical protein VFT59_00935 [Candidatus Saccharimonadales bacterium]|nr:hypothetical protein [Candidatus Saccharimonadales bacterium]
MRGSDMHVSFEVRLRIADQDGRYAMLVRGNELARGNRVLIPFGGGILATDKDKAALTMAHEGADLRFTIGAGQWTKIVDYFTTISEDRLYHEAWREFYEEACNERAILTPEECAGCRLIRLRKVRFIDGSVRHATFGEPTLYLIGIVTMLPSRATLTRLLAAPSTQVEFVSREQLLRGGLTEQNSMVYAQYSYLV